MEPHPLLQGDRWRERTARAIFPLLIEYAKKREPSTYGDLMDDAHDQGLYKEKKTRLDPVRVPSPLGVIGRTLENVAGLRGIPDKIPPLTALIRNQITRLPSDGSYHFIEHYLSMETGSLNEEILKNNIEEIYKHIFEFSEWDEVLKACGLPSLTESRSHLSSSLNAGASSPTSGGYGKGGEETELHWGLADYICENPEAVGLSKKVRSAEREYLFLSLDRVDVYFQYPKEEVIVEVKGLNSSSEDIRRGIHQCVKYLALLQAEQRITGRPETGRAILALGGEMPKELRAEIAKLRLPIEVVEGIKHKSGERA